MLYGEVFPVGFKMLVLQVVRGLEKERDIFLLLPAFGNKLDLKDDVLFTTRFKEVLLNLSKLAREADRMQTSESYRE